MTLPESMRALPSLSTSRLHFSRRPQIETGMDISLPELTSSMPSSPPGGKILRKILIDPDWVICFLKHHMAWVKDGFDWPGLGRVWLLWLGTWSKTFGPRGWFSPLWMELSLRVVLRNSWERWERWTACPLGSHRYLQNIYNVLLNHLAFPREAEPLLH